MQRDPERARAALKDVKRLGVSIALDSFGSGQYSLGLPNDLPLDVVKLDRGAGRQLRPRQGEARDVRRDDRARQRGAA